METTAGKLSTTPALELKVSSKHLKELLSRHSFLELINCLMPSFCSSGLMQLSRKFSMEAELNYVIQSKENLQMICSKYLSLLCIQMMCMSMALTIFKTTLTTRTLVDI